MFSNKYDFLVWYRLHSLKSDKLITFITLEIEVLIKYENLGRGIHFFHLYLIYIEKHFDDCLMYINKHKSFIEHDVPVEILPLPMEIWKLEKIVTIIVD